MPAVGRRSKEESKKEVRKQAHACRVAQRQPVETIGMGRVDAYSLTGGKVSCSSLSFPLLASNQQSYQFSHTSAWNRTETTGNKTHAQSRRMNFSENVPGGVGKFMNVVMNTAARPQIGRLRSIDEL